jgi:AcrR family transcriptional regulator
MRVTAKTKEKTRKLILKVAVDLFQQKGFSQTTTRDIAASAKIATGTMFNYFATKEELGLVILGECLRDAAGEFRQRRRGDEALDELLFSHIASGLRHLRPHRSYVSEVLIRGLGPHAQSALAGEGERIRTNQLDTVRELIVEINGQSDSEDSEQQAEPPIPSAVALHLYWTLFLGVLGYWAIDESPHQEDTLVLLDQSMRLFVNALADDSGETPETPNGSTRE